jgi:hypothetical protein
MNADVIEIAARDVRRQGRPLAEQLADGKVAVLRDVPALRLFRAELIRAASDAAQSSAAAAELTEFYEHGRAPGIAALHGLVAAIKSTRDERYLSECLAPLVRDMGFPTPVLVDGGINRLVLPPDLVGKTRDFANLFVPTDYQREAADGPTETFMPGPSNIHRDFDRDHYLLMCNIWAPLHDATEEEIVQVYPGCYRKSVHSMPNTAENRQALGEPVRISLRFGDCLVFHGENMHHSPDPAKARGRRHSYDFRIAASCPDDNRHYRYNFVNLANFRSGAHDMPSAAKLRETVADVRGHHSGQGECHSANYYWRNLEKQQTPADKFAATLEIYSRYLFAEDRYLALAGMTSASDRELTRRILADVLRQTSLVFYALKCAEQAAACGHLELTEHACDRVLALAERTPALRRFAPVDYAVPTTQLLPHAARIQAEALRAHARAARESFAQENPKHGLFSSLLRRFRRSA